MCKETLGPLRSPEVTVVQTNAPNTLPLNKRQDKKLNKNSVQTKYTWIVLRLEKLLKRIKMYVLLI